MKKKVKTIVFCLIILMFIIGSLFFIWHKKTNNVKNLDNISVIYDEKGNVIYDETKKDEITEVVQDTVIQGIVELKHNGFIYIFNGQHFGEYGFEIEEYTRANINDKKQKCIDYFTLNEYDTSYIQEGDLLICSGNLMKKAYNLGDSDFDTKNNSIIVLKSNDYNKMKQEIINGNSRYSSIITIGDVYTETGDIYIKYNLEDDTHSDTGYNFPFAVKPAITDNTKIIGNLQRGKAIKVEYEDLKAPLNELILKSIEVIDN